MPYLSVKNETYFIRSEKTLERTIDLIRYCLLATFRIEGEILHGMKG